jgi:hypothetical protein
VQYVESVRIPGFRSAFVRCYFSVKLGAAITGMPQAEIHFYDQSNQMMKELSVLFTIPANNGAALGPLPTQEEMNRGEALDIIRKAGDTTK